MKQKATIPSVSSNNNCVVCLCYGAAHARSPLWQALQAENLHTQLIYSVKDAVEVNAALVLLDSQLVAREPFSEWRAALPKALLLSENSTQLSSDMILSDGLPVRQTLQLIAIASETYSARINAERSKELLSSTEKNLSKLASVGIALASENDLGILLRKILTEGQNISCCDAASLFLTDTEGKRITFKLTQNDSFDFPFQESSFPLDVKSIAGNVAITKQALNISDAYQIPEDAPYKFNRNFDDTTGYRTVSMLTLPAFNKRKSVIAVLQFINKKNDRSLTLTPGNHNQETILPFDSASFLLLQALAGQAGVAIENAILHNDIQKLFEGFVRASVMAIEQRDPTTSGHSFRVADLCVALAEAVNDSHHQEHKNHQQSPQQLRELRYAALLHDFGKVGVRESVLVKAKKLSVENLERIRYRILIAKERLYNTTLREQIQLMQNGLLTQEKLSKLQSNLTQEVEKLDGFFETIRQVNEPSILEADSLEKLTRVANYCLPFEHDEDFSVISEDEFKLLSIRKGSLSAEERAEIESHVTHTKAFLNLIPWTEELKNIPEIAGSHHEKLNGTGYPKGIRGDQIPFSSKVMTICDIYDALTASDRPYKTAVSTEKALEIMQNEAAAGAIDGQLLELFISRKIYRVTEGKNYSGENALNFSNHACSFDFHSAH
ncbi:MAG: HD domain-containing phosphohydrolase [Pseudomonadota bacterium]